MPEVNDDPGPGRNRITDSDYWMFSDIREIIDQKEDGTVGISLYTRKSTGIRSFGNLVCRMGLLMPDPCLRLFVLQMS
jgi:hypothetical protein